MQWEVMGTAAYIPEWRIQGWGGKGGKGEEGGGGS